MRFWNHFSLSILLQVAASIQQSFHRLNPLQQSELVFDWRSILPQRFGVLLPLGNCFHLYPLNEQKSENLRGPKSNVD